ncbi:MAG TPA: pitrilysin family protein, partial [Burkholderiaceae bacterium]|nr:pitrilysin family protein [Burkholderiaceae bacterium]
QKAVGLAMNTEPRGDVRHVRSFEEEEADVKAVTLEQVKAFHAAFYGASQAQLALVGDFDAASVKSTATGELGSWKAQTAYGRIPRQHVDKPGQVQLLRTPDKQNAMMLGIQSLPLDDTTPDYAALQLANHILGGGGSSRLWTRIREKEGLSYGTGTGVNLGAEDPSGAWYVYAIFAPQNREKVETALREEVARALKDGFSAKELDEAKQALLNQRRLGLAQDGAVAGMLSSQQRLDRSFAREQQLDEALQKQTLEQVNTALRKHFKLEAFQLVFAGDFK